MARGKKTGGGSRLGRPNKRSEGIADWARVAVEDLEYRRNLVARLKDGELAPAVETMLFYYAYGKPYERLEHTGANNGPIELLYGRKDKVSLV